MTGIFVLLPLALAAAQSANATSPAALPQVKRIYVAQLAGDASAEALRELIIASIDSTKLFVLTDNPERADAVLKGAAQDESYTDTFDSSESVNMHQSLGGKSSGSSSSRNALGGGAGDSESHHSRERRQQAYASVRLCNKDGDVLWSTTQESLGAKFRGAGADVAAKIARQLTADMDRAMHPPAAPAP